MDNGSTALYHLPGFYEPFNAISHMPATVVFLVLGRKLVQRGRADRKKLLFPTMYSSACVFLLSMFELGYARPARFLFKSTSPRIDP